MVMRVDRMFSPEANRVWKYTLTLRPGVHDPTLGLSLAQDAMFRGTSPASKPD
jgi:hypothetical protein